MENEVIFKITFWTATIMMFTFSVGILLLLQQIYHNLFTEIKRKTLTNLPENTQKKSINNVLSEREMQILVLTLRGYSAFDISDELSISRRTVENHKKNMMEKTGSKNFISVINYTLSHQFLSPEELKD